MQFNKPKDFMLITKIDRKNYLSTNYPDLKTDDDDLLIITHLGIIDAILISEKKQISNSKIEVLKTTSKSKVQYLIESFRKLESTQNADKKNSLETVIQNVQAAILSDRNSILEAVTEFENRFKELEQKAEMIRLEYANQINLTNEAHNKALVLEKSKEVSQAKLRNTMLYVAAIGAIASIFSVIYNSFSKDSQLAAIEKKLNYIEGKIQNTGCNSIITNSKVGL